MELTVRVRIKESGAWRDAVLREEPGKANGNLNILSVEENMEIPVAHIGMIRVLNCHDFDKERYTAAIVLIQKALQAGFKVTW
ncbi:MAG: hypothetical protein H6Q42_1791 [Deltaproteobacteria bacterium]|jgi:hypothetical protein|nr:hypothetical protein [Deltaproteobacteria bacterium]